MLRVLVAIGFSVQIGALTSMAVASEPADKSPKVLPNGMEVIDIPIAKGPWEPSWSSIGDHFQSQAPGWWRHPKIGIRLHWGPQSAADRATGGTPSP